MMDQIIELLLMLKSNIRLEYIQVGTSIVSKLIVRAEELYQAEYCKDATLHHKW